MVGLLAGLEVLEGVVFRGLLIDGVVALLLDGVPFLDLSGEWVLAS